MKITITLLLVLALLPFNISAYDSPQWHLPEGAKARIGKGWIRDVEYSPDGARFAVAGPIGIWIYDATTFEEIDLFDGNMAPIDAITFSRNGELLASGGNFFDDTVRLWDATTGELLRTLSGHGELVRDLEFS